MQTGNWNGLTRSVTVEALATLRFRDLGCHFMQSGDFEDISVSKILHFIQGAGLLNEWAKRLHIRLLMVGVTVVPALLYSIQFLNNTNMWKLCVKQGQFFSTFIITSDMFTQPAFFPHVFTPTVLEVRFWCSPITSPLTWTHFEVWPLHSHLTPHVHAQYFLTFSFATFICSHVSIQGIFGASSILCHLVCHHEFSAIFLCIIFQVSTNYGSKD
jgi:hypothetical protein